MNNFLFPFPACSALNLFYLTPRASRTRLPVIPSLTNLLLPSTGVIGIFMQVPIDNVVRNTSMGWARAAYGGRHLIFRAPHDAAWAKVIFLGYRVGDLFSPRTLVRLCRDWSFHATYLAKHFEKSGLRALNRFFPWFWWREMGIKTGKVHRATLPGSFQDIPLAFLHLLHTHFSSHSIDKNIFSTQHE